MSEKKIHKPSCWEDFIVDLTDEKRFEGDIVLIQGKEYLIGDIEDYIDSYGLDRYSQISDDLEELQRQSLLTLQ
jgi:hypothetical protein